MISLNQRAASRIAASLIVNVTMDSASEAQSTSPPNVTLQITLSSPCFELFRWFL